MFLKYKNGKFIIKFIVIWIKTNRGHTNISDYENKSTKDLIKALSGPKRKLGINKNKLKEIKKDFYNLRHKCSKEEAGKYRKLFYDIKNYWDTFLEEIRKNFNELEKM